MDNKNRLNLSSFPKELRLLLEIMKKEEYDSNSINKDLYNDIDWFKFLQLARHHRVYPFIYSILKKTDKNQIPTHVIQTLYKEFKQNTFQMLQLSGEMEQISKLFTESGVRLLFLKGPVIAADIYGDISLRTSKDLDILIPINDLKRAEELLLSNGYEKEIVPNVLNEWKWRHHHVVYFHPIKNILIEIHWRLQPPPMKEPKFEKLWRRKRVSTITSNPVYFLGKEDLFLYLVSHGSRHGWFRLRWLLDIDRMLRGKLKIGSIKKIMKEYSNHNIVGQTLILTSELFNSPLDGNLEKLIGGKNSKKIAQNCIDFIRETESLATIMSTKNYKYYLFSIKSILQKAFSIMILFYPSSLDPLTLRLPKSIHFLYFPLRPFLWALRKASKPAK